MSVKFKKDLGLKDYLDLIAKQNDAIIDQLMVDKDIMTTTFRKANYNQYKESIKDYTVAGKVETPKSKIEEEVGATLDDYLDGGAKVETPIHKSEGSSAPDNVGTVVIVVIVLIFIFSIIILAAQ